MDVAQVLAVLASAPSRLARVASSPRTSTRPSADAWSAVEVLAHLRACADVWGGCIERLLAEDGPTIRAVNPRTHQESTDYASLDFASSLAAFVEQREALLEVLRRLSDEQWQRSATVTGAGRPLTRTVLSYAQWLAEHERPHLRQVERAVAAQSQA